MKTWAAFTTCSEKLFIIVCHRNKKKERNHLINPNRKQM